MTMPELDIHGGPRVTRRLDRAAIWLTRLRRPSAVARNFDVTCRTSVVIAEGGMTDQVRLVAFADALLYEVERAGKNALRIAETGEAAPERERRAA